MSDKKDSVSDGKVNAREARDLKDKTGDIGEVMDGTGDPSKDEDYIVEKSDVDLEVTKAQWIDEQLLLSKRVTEEDCEAVKKVGYFGGLDVSFIIGDPVNACACYVVLDKDLGVVYRDLRMVQLTAPYMPGFLGFREAAILSQLVTDQVASSPGITPGVLMVDGNGILHPRLCGTACHVALTTGLPTLGVAKNLHCIDQLGEGLDRESIKQKFQRLEKAGEHLDLVNREGKVLGAAMKTSRDSRNPVYVSVGSGLCLATALALVSLTARHRVPEPIRQADILSREFLRIHHPTPRQIQAEKQPGRTRAQKMKHGKTTGRNTTGQGTLGQDTTGHD